MALGNWELMGLGGEYDESKPINVPVKQLTGHRHLDMTGFPESIHLEIAIRCSSCYRYRSDSRIVV